MSVLEQFTPKERQKRKTTVRQSWFGWIRCKFFRKRVAIKYKYWHSDSLFVGFLEDYSDYWTQGKTVQELEEHLVDIFKEVNNPESLGANDVHNELPNDDVPLKHKTDVLVVEV